MDLANSVASATAFECGHHTAQGLQDVKDLANYEKLQLTTANTFDGAYVRRN